MKVLIIQSAGLHDGKDGWCQNDYLRECHALKYGFEGNNIEVDIWGLRHKNFSDIPEDVYDLVVLAEQYEFDKWIPPLCKFKKAKKIQWIVDLHYQGTGKYAKFVEDCDIILHATRCLMEGFRKQFSDNIKHIWFPNAVDSRFYDGHGIRVMEKKEDLVFVGSDHNSRRSYVQGLKKDCGLKEYFLTGNDMMNKIINAKIHFNKNISCDINYRTFETIGLGTCLVTNNDPDLGLLGFKDGENCILYDTYEECREKIKVALSSGSWKTISEKGFELSKKHTYIERVKDLLNNI